MMDHLPLETSGSSAATEEGSSERDSREQTTPRTPCGWVVAATSSQEKELVRKILQPNNPTVCQEYPLSDGACQYSEILCPAGQLEI